MTTTRRILAHLAATSARVADTLAARLDRWLFDRINPPWES